MFVYHEFFSSQVFYSHVENTCMTASFQQEGYLDPSNQLSHTPFNRLCQSQECELACRCVQRFCLCFNDFFLEFGNLYCRLCSFVCLYVQFVCLFFCQILSCSVAFNFAYHYDFGMFISRLWRGLLDTMSCDRVLMFSWSRHLTKNKILNYIKQKYDVKINKHTWS